MDHYRLRHGLLRALSVAVLLAYSCIPSLAFANNNAGLRTMQLHISNHMNLPLDLYVLIWGVINRDNGFGFHVGDFVYVTDAQGNVAKPPAIPAPGQGLGIKVGMGTDTDLMLPKLSAIRIYFSLGQALVTQNGGVAGGALSPPDVENPSDPNFNTIFDSIETTWQVQAPIPGHPEITTNFGPNTTEVDQFGLTLQYTAYGTDPANPNNTNYSVSGGFLSTARRAALFDTLQGFGFPWSNLIVGGIGRRARAISPNHAIHGTLLNTGFPANYLDQYINNVFSQYATSQVTATVSAAACDGCPTVIYNFTGSTAGGEFVFSDASKGGPIFSLAKWSTFNAYEGNFPYGSVVPTDSYYRPDATAAGVVKASLQAALMRTTLLVNPNLTNDPASCPNPSTFYNNAPVNMYAKLWHANGIGGKAYGFGFDDVCSQSSFNLVFNPTAFTVTLLGNRP